MRSPEEHPRNPNPGVTVATSVHVHVERQYRGRRNVNPPASEFRPVVTSPDQQESGESPIKEAPWLG